MLCEEYNKRHRINKRGHINITGGEPFIREDIGKILEYISQRNFTCGILSNGSFIDGDVIALLKRINISFVQLSIDGNREMHDSLRAAGDYDRVFGIARKLQKSGIRTYISFTANKTNYRYLPEVAKKCRKCGLTKLWSDRLVPIGNGGEIADLAITDKEMSDYVRTMKKAQGGFFTKLFYPKTQVTMNRALQFINSDGGIYSCSAGNSLITVDEFGNIMPCRRMPIICGNIRTDTLSQIYYNHKTFIDLRMPSFPKECKDCTYKYVCKGGARCQSHAVYTSYRKCDPACFLQKKEEE